MTEQNQQKVANENAEGHAEGDLKDSAGMLSAAHIAQGYEGSDRRENGLVVTQDALSEKPSAHRRRNNLHRLKEIDAHSVHALVNELSSTTSCVAKNVCELCHGNHHTVESSGARGGRVSRFCDVRPAPPARSGAHPGVC